MGVTLAVLVTNAALAGILCLVAWLASHVVRRPTVVHALWALALLELVTPPLLPVPLLPPVPWSSGTALAVTPASTLAAAPLGAGPAAAVRPATRGYARPPGLEVAAELALGAGVLAVLALAFVRARRFRRLLGRGHPAPAALAARIDHLAVRLGLRRVPRITLVDAYVPPLLWPGSPGPRLVLPARLVPQLAPEELDALLVHELAHVRRRDHWLRFVEILATAFFWWYPVAWWLRRSMRRFEERCCDEWVLRLMPGAAVAHARGLLKAAAFASAEAPELPPVASAATRAGDLEDRLTALLTRPPVPLAGRGPRAALAALAVIMLFVSPVSCHREPLGELTADLLVLEGAPGDPLVKYVGLPVKVVPEATFRAQIDESRQRTAERARPVVPDATRRQAEAEAAVVAAREEVDRARAVWLDSPADTAQRARAERAYVAAMRRKDELVRRAGEAASGKLYVVTAANASWFVEMEFEELTGAIAETRTDSNGRFTVRVPRRGSYVIAMPVPGRGGWAPLGTVSYYWRASLDGRPAKRLTLRGETGVEGQAPFLVARRPPR